MGKEIRNAKITSTTLGIDEHYSFWIGIDYGGSTGQNFGGYGLGGEFTDYVLRGILETLDVGTWEKLKGTSIRVESDHTKVYRIGHYLEDKWFDPSGFSPQTETKRIDDE